MLFKFDFLWQLLVLTKYYFVYIIKIIHLFTPGEKLSRWTEVEKYERRIGVSGTWSQWVDWRAFPFSLPSSFLPSKNGIWGAKDDGSNGWGLWETEACLSHTFTHSVWETWVWSLAPYDSSSTAKSSPQAQNWQLQGLVPFPTTPMDSQSPTPTSSEQRFHSAFFFFFLNLRPVSS